MIDAILDEKTLDCKQAVFFATGSLKSVAQQFVDVQKYCKNKQLSIISIFVEESNDEQKLYAALNEMLDFLAKEKQKTAIVMASPENLPEFVHYFDIMNLIIDDNIEFHFARSKIRLFKK